MEELVGFEKQCLEFVQQHEMIALAMVLDPQGKILFHHDPSRMGSRISLPGAVSSEGRQGDDPTVFGLTSGIFPIRIPVLDQGREVASVLVGYPEAQIKAHIRASTLRALAVASFFFTLALGLLVAGLYFWVRRPLSRVTAVMQGIQNNEYGLDKRVPVLARDEIGQMAGAFNQMLDTLQQSMVSKKALEASEDRYRDLVEFSGFFICTHDLKGRVFSANPEVARNLGYEVEDLLGANIQDILPPEFEPEFATYLQALQRDGFAQGLMQVQTRSGEKRIWEYKNNLRSKGVAEPVVRGMAQDVTERLEKAKERERLIKELQEALDQVTTLKGFIPICANCKKIRDDQGFWNQIESYIQQHSDARFSHGICPECVKKLYPELDE